MQNACPSKAPKHFREGGVRKIDAKVVHIAVEDMGSLSGKRAVELTSESKSCQRRPQGASLWEAR